MRLEAAALVLCLILSGCGPILSAQTMKEVDRSITFEELIQNPDSFLGRIALVGGRIIETTVTEKETWVEVLQLPLGNRDRPEAQGMSSGRFLLRYNGFQDPDVYARGVPITVAGIVEGRKTLPIGEKMYDYPLLDPVETHLWGPDSAYPPFFSIGIGVGAVF